MDAASVRLPGRSVGGRPVDGCQSPGAQQTNPESNAALSPAAYRAELDRLLVVIDRIEGRPADIPRLIESLPASWRVEDGRDQFTVTTAWLQRDLESVRRAPNPQSVARIRGRLLRLRDELVAYEESPLDLADQRAHLNSVLARPEFSGVHGPTWFDRLRQRALSFLVDLLDRMIGSSNIPAIGRFVVWTLVGLAMLVVAIVIFRTLRRTTRVGTIRPEEMPVSAKSWTIWLAEARAAAAASAWRDAVRLGLLGGRLVSRVSPPVAARPRADAARVP